MRSGANGGGAAPAAAEKIACRECGQKCVGLRGEARCAGKIKAVRGEPRSARLLLTLLRLKLHVAPALWLVHGDLVLGIGEGQGHYRLNLRVVCIVRGLKASHAIRISNSCQPRKADLNAIKSAPVGSKQSYRAPAWVGPAASEGGACSVSFGASNVSGSSA